MKDNRTVRRNFVKRKVEVLTAHADRFPLGSRDLFVLQRTASDYLPVRDVFLSFRALKVSASQLQTYAPPTRIKSRAASW